MSTNKSVSPAEFRVHNKVFKIDFAPTNYFERLRFEMIIQKLVFWFWRYYGIYFYVQKLKFLDNKILFQVYFYKTYLYQRFIKKAIKFKTAKGVDSLELSIPHSLKKYNFKWLHFYNPELFNTLILFKNKKQQKKKVKIVTIGKTGRKKFFRWKKGGSLYKKSPSQKLNTAISSEISFNIFFTYFFLHFFKTQSVILIKSLYKVVTANPHFKLEHQKLLYNTRYLKRHRWSFDFLFLMNYALTFSDTNIILPFFINHIIRKYRQFKYALMFFNILRKLYFFKRNIRSIKVLLNGPYNRHGRTHFRIFKIGDIAISQSQSCVLYDVIQWITPYGAVSLKLWIYYSDYLINN